MAQPLAATVHPSGADSRTASTQRLRPMLGTWVSIEAACDAGSPAAQALEAAYAAVGLIERCLHPLRPDSDLVRIAQSGQGERTPIHAATWTVLRFAQRLHQASGGVFDPCVPGSPAGLEALQLSPEADAAAPPCWAVRYAPVELDCGGLAKGYAVDCAVAALTGAGCVSGLVNAGGDVRSFGARQDTLLLRPAHRGDGPMPAHRTVVLENGALAVSDRAAHGRPPQHRGYYDRTQRASTAATAATAATALDFGSPAREFAAVLAPEAMTADALTKCVLLCTPEASARLLHQFDAREI